MQLTKYLKQSLYIVDYSPNTSRILHDDSPFAILIFTRYICSNKNAIFDIIQNIKDCRILKNIKHFRIQIRWRNWFENTQ